MKKIIFAERRSGGERRLHARRSFKRFLRAFWKPSTYRRHRTRRALYVRRSTYTVYLPERI